MLDSYRTLWSGEENDSRAATNVLQPLRSMLRRHHVAGIMPVHVGRQDRNYRGSEALAASVEFGFKLARAEGDPDPQRRYVECWKARPCAEPPTRWLRFGFESGVFVIDEAEPFEAPAIGRPPRASDELRPRILDALGADPMGQAEVARAVGRQRTDGTLRRALEALERDGEIRRLQGGKWGRAESARSAMPPSPRRGAAFWHAPDGTAPGTHEDTTP